MDIDLTTLNKAKKNSFRFKIVFYYKDFQHKTKTTSYSILNHKNLRPKRVQSEHPLIFEWDLINLEKAVNI